MTESSSAAASRQREVASVGSEFPPPPDFRQRSAYSLIPDSRVALDASGGVRERATKRPDALRSRPVRVGDDVQDVVKTLTDIDESPELAGPDTERVVGPVYAAEAYGLARPDAEGVERQADPEGELARVCPALDHVACQVTDEFFGDDPADAATLNLEGDALEQARDTGDALQAGRQRDWEATYIKRLRLQVVSGPDLGLTLVLRDGGRCVLGRALTSSLSFRDLSVSRRHVALMLCEGRLTFKDLASGNGVRVNRNRLKEGIWYPGDSVYLGTNRLVIEPLESVPRHTMDSSARRAEGAPGLDPERGGPLSAVDAVLPHRAMLGHRTVEWLVAGAAFGVTAALTLWLVSTLFGTII